ncbi:uncharacterized protein LOC135483397 [Lineus longissimus]|uniref:uncharacterized protein LOC135483397 n=1 Tax=Lineus longissimus TaxID=88925 RepID=UPI00315D0F84
MKTSSSSSPNDTAIMAAPQTDAMFTLIIEACTKYVWAFLVTLGIPGNILALVISLQRTNRTNAACLYMAAIAAADTLLLVFYGVCQSTMFWIVKESLGEVPLQFCWYTAYTFGPISGLCLALMSIDRVIAVRFPLQAIRLCTTGRAKRAAAITYTIVITLNLHIFFVYEQDGPLMLRVLSREYPFLETLVVAFHLFIGTLLPLSIIVVCNIWIIFTLKSSNIKMADQKGGHRSREKDTTYITRMLIIVCFAYVMTSMPYRLSLTLIDGIQALRQLYDMNLTYWKVRYAALAWITSNLWHLNYAINFYLYCVAGGARYRNDVKRFFHKVCICGERH